MEAHFVLPSELNHTASRYACPHAAATWTGGLDKHGAPSAGDGSCSRRLASRFLERRCRGRDGIGRGDREKELTTDFHVWRSRRTRWRGFLRPRKPPSAVTETRFAGNGNGLEESPSRWGNRFLCRHSVCWDGFNSDGRTKGASVNTPA